MESPTLAARMSIEETICDWWLRQIHLAIPWLDVRNSAPPEALVIEVGEFSVKPPLLTGSILVRRGGREVFIAALGGPVALPSGAEALSPIGLRLPKAMTLRRTLVLPSKAIKYLKTAIGFEMDRITPFSVAEVFYSYDLKRERENLKLSLLIVPRLTVQPLFVALSKMDITPSFIESGSGIVQLRRRIKPPNPVRTTLWFICVFLGLCIATIPVLQQQRHLNELTHQLKSLAPEQKKLLVVHQELATAELNRQISEISKENADELRELQILTDALPNGTWLTSLTMTSNEITFSGESSDAAHLILVLSASPSFHDASLIGPITYSSITASETFTIQAFISE